MSEAEQARRIANAIHGLFDVYRPEGVAVWLRGSNMNLGGMSPLDLLSEGSVDRFVAAVDGVRGGGGA